MKPGRREILLCLLLALATLSVYGQLRHHEFIALDDPDYVTEQPVVRKGLTLHGTAWAFTTGAAANWHPLTWLSHMLDVELFGLDAGAHHRTSVWLHLLAAIVLFLALHRMTGASGPSAFVAAVFALHPLHVESVAWVAERKDVLSGLLFALVLWSYARYAERPAAGRYLVVLGAFALGLLAKPMLVTVPFVLLLLDHWPLRREVSPRRLVVEKIPIFLLAAASSAVTWLVQHRFGAVAATGTFPVGVRIANAALSYVAYVTKSVWPTELAVYYPYPRAIQGAPALLAGAALLTLSILAASQWRRRPYLPVGWFWYLGTLVPVIGLVQVGSQRMADRYTYLPLIGLSIALAFSVREPAFGRIAPRPVLRAFAVAVVVALGLVTYRTAAYWKNSSVLFERALSVTSDNYLVHNAYGAVLERRGEVNAAMVHYAEAARVRPTWASPRLQMARVLEAQGKHDEAASRFAEALRLRPDDATVRFKLANALFRAGRLDAAIAEYSTILRAAPENAEVWNNLGSALLGSNRLEEAIESYREAVRLRPDLATARTNLAGALVRAGRADESVPTSGLSRPYTHGASVAVPPRPVDARGRSR